MKRRICVFALCIGVVLVGRSPSLRAQEAVKGLRYWLPVDIAILDVMVVTTKTTEYVVTQSAEKGGKLQKRTTTEVTREGQLAIRTQADHDVKTLYALDSVAGKLADTGLSMQVSAAGLLQSVNPTSRGRGPELLTAVAKFIGTAASAVLGNPLGALSLKAGNLNLLSRTTDAMNARAAKADPTAAKPPVVEAPKGCNPFEAPISTQPLRVRALLSSNEPACVVFWLIQDRVDALESFQAQRLRLEGELDTTKPDDLPALRLKIADRTKAINATSAELATLQARLMALLEAFVSDEGLGVKTSVERYSTTLNLAELQASLEAMAEAQKAFFKTTGVAVIGKRLGGADAATVSTVDSQPSSPPANESKADRKAREKLEAEARKAASSNKVVSIHFRQARPWRIEVRASKCSLLEPAEGESQSAPCRKDDKPGDPTTTNTELRTAQVVDLISGDTEPSSMSFTSAAFSDKGLSIVFDEKGRPTQVQRSGGSSLAGIATAVAGAAASARDEYANGLAKLVEIQASRQKLAMVGVNAEIERLQKQKDLIEAKLAASSGAQSFDLLLQQNQLNADLALLKARFDKENAEKTFEDRLDLEKMKVDLEQLKTDVERVKAQQALDELNKPKSSGG